MSYLTGDPLGVRIRIAFGASIAANPATWVWTDVTAWWHTPDDVQIGWGRTSGAEQPETSTLSLTLKNTDGRFTAFDARSPYWPNVRKWTPIQYDIDLGDGIGWRNRFSGFIRKWPLTWPGASPLMALARIEAVGVLGRIGRGKPRSRSVMARTIAASGALAYWPIEDGTDASVAGSAYPDHAPLSITGPVAFAPIEAWTEERGYEVRYGTAALADISASAALSATVPATVTTATGGATGWTVSIAADVGDTAALSADLVLLEVLTPGGTFVRWQMLITKTNRTQIIGYNSAGAPTWVVDDASTFLTMVPHNMTVFQDGAGFIRAGFSWSSVGGYEGTGSVPGTVAGVTGVAVNPTGVTATGPIPVGHLAVWAGHDLPAVDIRDGKVILALFGYAWTGIVTGASAPTGEPAAARLARLLAEDGLTLNVPAVAAADQAMMGVQQPGTPLALYQQCETADQGLIYEASFGLGYLPRSARYNAPVSLTIDAAAGQLGLPFEPVDDDQMLRNLWTVERTDGSSAVAADQQSIDLQGEIEGSDSVNLASDAPLPDHANWRLHLSTVQEPRYPALSINLTAHPELAAAWTACKPGSRIQVVNPPAQNVPGVIDQLVVGASETYRGRRSWQATLNVQPASPWQVATADGEQRAAADGSTLAAALTATPTTLNSNPYFETDASGWFTNAGEGSIARSTAQSHEGAASLLLTPDGVGTQAAARSVAATGVTPGQVLHVAAWMRCAVARSVTLRVDWRNSAGTFLSSTTTAIAVAANTWTFFELVATAPANTAQAGITGVMTGTPPASHTLHIDEAILTTTVTMLLASTAANGPWTTDPADMPLDVRVGGERVTASAIGRYVDDGFDRTVSGSWGTEPTTGLVWAAAGGAATQYGVTGGGGWHDVEVLNTTRRTRLPVSLRDVEVLMMCASNALAAGGNIECSPMMRIDPADIGGTYYYCEVEFSTTQTVRARLMRRQASVDTPLTTAFDIPGLVHAANRVFWTRAQVFGDWVRMRVWQDGTPEPSGWTVAAQDPAPLLTPGQVGVRSTLDPTSTNPLPVRLTIWHFAVTNPQTVVLSARAVNGFSRPWPAGTEVDVWAPAIASL